MRILLQFLSSLMLLGIILPSMLYFTEHISLEQTKLYTLIATVGWFIVTPFWMGRADSTSATQ